MNLNLVAIQGNLVDKPNIVGKENNVARFSIAVNNGFGEKRETVFVDCVAFGKQVAVIEKYFEKGKQIIVNGALAQNKWEDAEGNKRSRLEVRLNNFNGFSFVSGSGGNNNSEQESSETPEEKFF